MPIAVRLSRAFYDRFGDEIVDELVGVLNQVDAAFQGSLRELNELNFARFDDRLERRLASLEARLSSQLVTHMRWMIGILVMMFIAVIGLWFRH